ncbi:MAG: dienelactone hydrolase family protein [Alphaproteobacteria bacterium]|nr:dienelactone hydrolase family protein [Alphaproteobacteria bacterium]
MLPLLLSLACAPPVVDDTVERAPLDFEPAGPDAAPDPGTWGPFPVGVTTMWFTDPNRTLEDGSPREFPVEVWYPAAAAEGTLRTYPLADIVPPERAELEGLDLDSLATVTTHSWEEAPPERTWGPFPLVIFSHGNGAIRQQSMYLTEVLASHGFVVAAPDHVGNTLYDMLVPGASEDSSMTGAFAYRPEDITQIADALLGASEPAPVSDMGYGMTGHSLGGWTSFRMAALDDRVLAVVPQAPPDVGLALIGTSEEPNDLEMPILIQAGDLDDTLSYEDNAVSSFQAMSSPAAMVTYLGAGHFTFSDLCVFDLGPIAELIYDSVGGVLDDGCGPQNLDPLIAQPIIRHHAIALFNGVLRDSPGSLELLWDGPEPTEVYLTEGEPW